jgi:hypothetical protein
MADSFLLSLLSPFAPCFAADACHRVPDSATLGYKVTCTEGEAAGVFSVCTDAQCENCAVNTPFADDQCLPNPPEFGSSSVQLRCTNVNQAAPTPGPGNAVITWSAAENCGEGARTIVVVQNDVCETVPEASPAGYRVQCNAQGTGGVFQVCEEGGTSENACQTCGA